MNWLIKIKFKISVVIIKFYQVYSFIIQKRDVSLFNGFSNLIFLKPFRKKNFGKIRVKEVKVFNNNNNNLKKLRKNSGNNIAGISWGNYRAVIVTL